MKYILYGLALIPLAWVYSIVIGNNYKIQMILLIIQCLAIFGSGIKAIYDFKKK